MNGRIVAVFACSFLTVSATIPALAQEAGGIVRDIDRDTETVTLDDGSIFALPVAFDYAAVRPGMRVHVIYDAGKPDA